jgi:hypothetical protein
MPDQTGRNLTISYKVESVFNTPVSGAGAFQFRANATGGMSLVRQLIRSNEMRPDGQTSMPRLGSASVTGGYQADLSVGTFDPLFEAMFRSTWVAAVPITVDNTAPNTSFQVTSTSAVTYVGTTNLLTKGLRVGDVGRFTNMSNAANNNINVRIATVAADGLSFTTEGTPLTVQAADTAATFTIAKKLVQGTSATRRSFTWDEYNNDIDLSAIGTGIRISSLKLTGQPDGMALLDIGFVGADLTPLATGTSPNFTSPTLTTSVGLTWLDASIRVGATARTNLTGFEITFDLAAATQPVIGSNVTPDVFENPVTASGSMSSTLRDFTDYSAYRNETEFEFSALLVEPEAEPKDFISIFLSRCKFAGFQAPAGASGARIVTLPFEVGAKGVATGYDPTMVSFLTSAA